MDAAQILVLIQGLISAGIDAATAWQTVSTIVSQNRNPTDAEWSVANLNADEAHAAAQSA